MTLSSTALPNGSGGVLARCEVIARLNDDLRQNPFGAGKRTVVTRRVHRLGPAFVAEALVAVAEFHGFTVGKNSHGERDFGAFEVAGEKLAFTINYYDVDGLYASEDPADPSQTLRVMTVMFLDEY